ncbi:MAG: hypothetical protein HGA27_05620 [Peptococcaceae bacterium]|nr:hypothetical protein [Peptococcaceae bacterium]
MAEIIEEVKDLYKIVKLNPFRKTPGVSFDLFPMDIIPHIDAIDRVIHQKSAISPGPVGAVERPWYMHHYQDDNLIVLHGTREVELYTKAHGRIEKFTVTSDRIFKNGILIYEGGALLIWPRGVFHRIESGEEGSASLNIAVHYPGFDLKSNFSIYDLSTENGDYRVIRDGYQDQTVF